MADNSTQTGNDTIATDDLTTLNGGAVSGVKAERVKVGFGVDGTFNDVTPAVGMPIQGISATTTTASWTSATTVNTAATANIAGMNVVSVVLVPTTTFTGGVLTFEVSIDGTNYVPVLMARIDSYTTESAYTIVANTNRAWSTSVDGFNWFRVRLSTAITGTGTAAIAMIPQAFAIEPIVNVGQSTASNLNMTVGNQVTMATGTNLIAGGFQTTTTSSGILTAKVLSAATNNSTLVLTGTRTVYGWHFGNTSSGWRYVRFVNKATAPTGGTDSPLFVIPLPPGGGAVMQPSTYNLPFSLGLGYLITAGAADLDNTVTAANDVVGTIWYK